MSVNHKFIYIQIKRQNFIRNFITLQMNIMTAKHKSINRLINKLNVAHVYINRQQIYWMPITTVK